MLVLSYRYYKFLLAGLFFTLAGPSLFVVLASQLPPGLASFFSEILIHCLRYFSHSRFIFSENKVRGVRTYLSAAVPLSLLNILLAMSLTGLIGKIKMAILLGIIGSTGGYFWSKACYQYDLSAKIRGSRKKCHD
jgi:putative flippase GtrA